MKKTKISVTGEDKTINFKGKKQSAMKDSSAGFNIEEMLKHPNAKDLADLGIMMRDFQKTAAYKYLEARCFQEIKRTIKTGPVPGETVDRTFGRLQGILDCFEGTIKGTIISGAIAKSNIEKGQMLKNEDGEEVLFPK